MSDELKRLKEVLRDALGVYREEPSEENHQAVVAAKKAVQEFEEAPLPISVPANLKEKASTILVAAFKEGKKENQQEIADINAYLEAASAAIKEGNFRKFLGLSD